MIEFVRNKIAGKKLLVLGYGREGESTIRFLRRHYPGIKISVADQNERVFAGSEFSNIVKYSGPNYLDSIHDHDLIFKSPGISLNHLSFTFDQNRITSQTDIFLEYYSKQIIGITGTKGKSTTSSLLFHIFKSYKKDAVFVGNIGIPAFDSIEDILPTSHIVFELSSHQLEFISKSPHISILLNIYQEHLDHYKSFDDYKRAKMNIAMFQESGDYFILNAEDENTVKMATLLNPKGRQFNYSFNEIKNDGCFIADNYIHSRENNKITPVYDLRQERSIRGEHNIRNIMAAICACIKCGVPVEIINEGINSFKGLEHRIEYVGKYDGVEFYNDSIATIPEATIEAMKALRNVETIILGGYDRGIDYAILADYLWQSSVKNILFMGNAGQRILQLMNQKGIGDKNYFVPANMEEAVLLAKRKTATNGICLLSPSAASYDSFKNFEERGNAYKKIVRNSK